MTDFVREYSNALYSLSEEEGLQEEFNASLEEVTKLLDEQPDFVRLLSSYALTKGERDDIAEQVFRGRIHDYLLNFIKVLIDRNAFQTFGDCARAYHDRYNEAHGITDAYVTAPMPLKADTIKALTAKLNEIAGRRVVLHVSIDKTVIGGLRVLMDGRRYDNTIQTRLEQLRRELVR